MTERHRKLPRAAALPAVLCAAVLAAGAGPALAAASGANAAPAGRTHMNEPLRASIARVIIVAGQDPAEKELSGSYEKATPGLYGGMAQGGALGTPTTQVGPVTVSFPIPILTLPGMIAGGVAGATKREIQEFRDALAERIEQAADGPIHNDKLARYVYQELRPLESPEPGLFAASVPIPEDADAVLYVNLPAMSIDVDTADAVITTAAHLKLTRRNDSANLYERTVYYQDRAPLARWTDNENALFDDYANFALHWLGRELAAESFGRVDRPQAFRPGGSGSVKLARRNPWQAESKSLQPVLAWEPALAEAADAAGADAYEVEIYDAKRLVYQQRQLPGRSHALVTPLKACGEYFWSVRPVYRTDDGLRFGRWMRKPPEGDAEAPAFDGIAGRNAAEAPAYLQDFAALTIDCRAT